MTDESPSPVGKPRRKWLKRLLVLFVGIALACVLYVRTHPLIFNESFISHAHCIPQAGIAFRSFAGGNAGRFPVHTNGYGDALLLLIPNAVTWSVLTGPGYDSKAGMRWMQSGEDVPETECGRVYVQGLSETNNPDIAILFDKVPTPGGDHCHLLRRLTAPIGRDVLFVDGSNRTIQESQWAAFSSSQVELLVKEGYERVAAEQLYAEKGKER
jgi:hypothetical protein